MAAESAYEELWKGLHRLRDCLRDLRVTIEEDNPAAGDPTDVPTPVQRCVSDLGDALGYEQEALAASATALGAWKSGDRTIVEPLQSCQAAVNHVGRILTGDFSSFRRYAELGLVTSERRGEWPAWLRGFAGASDAWRKPYWEVHEQLRRCWADLAVYPNRASNKAQESRHP